MKSLPILLVIFFTQFIFGQNNIFNASRYGSVEDIKALMEINPDTINAINSNGHTPLILATYNKNNTVALFLIDNVESVDTKSKEGSPLMAAVVKGNVEIVEALLKKGANPDVNDTSNVTALIFATMFKHTEIVELLVNYKADKDIKDIRGFTALDYAKMMKEEKLLSLLKN